MPHFILLSYVRFAYHNRHSINKHRRCQIPYVLFTVGLVNKERELAGLQLEEKERETELWKTRYLQLQASFPTTFPPMVALPLYSKRIIS